MHTVRMQLNMQRAGEMTQERFRAAVGTQTLCSHLVRHGAHVEDIALAALPHIALTLTAFSLKWYGTILPENWSLLNFENALSNKLVVPSIINSLKYSSIAMLITLPLFAWMILAVIGMMSALRKPAGAGEDGIRR